MVCCFSGTKVFWLGRTKLVGFLGVAPSFGPTRFGLDSVRLPSEPDSSPNDGPTSDRESKRRTKRPQILFAHTQPCQRNDEAFHSRTAGGCSYRAQPAVGVQKLLQGREQRQRQQKEDLTEAFSDLKSLRQRAGLMVRMAKMLASQVSPFSSLVSPLPNGPRLRGVSLPRRA